MEASRICFTYDVSYWMPLRSNRKRSVGSHLGLSQVLWLPYWPFFPDRNRSQTTCFTVRDERSWQSSTQNPQSLATSFKIWPFHPAIPGSKLLYTPDTLSWAPVSDADPTDVQLQVEAENFSVAAISNLPASVQCLETYLTKQTEGPVCSQVIHHCQEGWPSKHHISSQLKPYR